MATLELMSATKRFGDVAAVDNVSLRVEDNEFFCIFGPPSSGKTTILRLLLGLAFADEGRILIDGEDVTFERPHERDLGMVFQNLALFPHLTARENIAFPLKERREPETTINQRVADVAGKMHIQHLLHKPPAQLSGGERQRVAIARALVRNPRAYLMDDPISALDARLRESTRVELKRLQRELRHTLIYVTHDQEEAMSIADRIAVLRDGAICQIGTPDEIYNRPNSLYVAQMVGSPRINALEGQLANGVFTATDTDVSLTMRDTRADCAATLCIRPEDIAIAPLEERHTFAADVYEVEPLGGHTIVDLDLQGKMLRAYLPGQPDVAPGQRVGVQIDSDQCALFSCQTGEVIRHAL